MQKSEIYIPVVLIGIMLFFIAAILFNMEAESKNQEQSISDSSQHVESPAKQVMSEYKRKVSSANDFIELSAGFFEDYKRGRPFYEVAGRIEAAIKTANEYLLEAMTTDVSAIKNAQVKEKATQLGLKLINHKAAELAHIEQLFFYIDGKVDQLEEFDWNNHRDELRLIEKDIEDFILQH